jgi:hypothetical protein
MKARVHGYPRHYHRKAHLNIGAVRRFLTMRHLCLPEMVQTRENQSAERTLGSVLDRNALCYKRGSRV